MIKLNVESAGELERPRTAVLSSGKSGVPATPHGQYVDATIDEEVTSALDVRRSVKRQERDYAVRKSEILAQMGRTVDDFKRTIDSYQGELSIRSGLLSVPTVEESRRYNQLATVEFDDTPNIMLDLNDFKPQGPGMNTIATPMILGQSPDLSTLVTMGAAVDRPTFVRTRNAASRSMVVSSA